MRIVAGAWRGRMLRAPQGANTRPTADRVRQALFDVLAHAPWAGRAVLEGALVLDAFAGSGALGLEALSRGAACAVFLERDAAAVAALRANVAACGAGERGLVLHADALRPPLQGTRPGTQACGLVFLDPPYGEGLVPHAVAALGAAGWIAPDALLVAEVGRDEAPPLPGTPLMDRQHGAARILAWRGVGT